MTEGHVEIGSRVSFSFTLSLTDGTRVEGTEAGESWDVVVGSGELPPGMDRALVGLAVGEHGQFFIPAAEGFGEADANTQEVLPRADFPADVDLIPGMAFGFTLPDGHEVMGKVVAVTAEGVEVDFSHPLVGHDLVFDVDIQAIGRV